MSIEQQPVAAATKAAEAEPSLSQQVLDGFRAARQSYIDVCGTLDEKLAPVGNFLEQPMPEIGRRIAAATPGFPALESFLDAVDSRLNTFMAKLEEPVVRHEVRKPEDTV